MFTEKEKQAINLIMLAESALFYCLTDNDKHSDDQAKQTIKRLREFLEENKNQIIEEGVL